MHFLRHSVMFRSRLRPRHGLIIGAGVCAVALAAAAGALTQEVPPQIRRDIALAVATLAAFVALLWRGASVFLTAPLLAAGLALGSATGSPLQFFEAHFARPVGTFVTQFLPIFMMSAIFGRLFADSGCARCLADAMADRVTRGWAPVAVAGLCVLMTLGGVGVFVIAFSVFPLARAVFARFELPLSLAPGAIAFGAFTFAMTAMPGSPSLTNIVAAAAFGTDTFAAPRLGGIAALTTALTGAAWLFRRASKAPRATITADAVPCPARQSVALAAAPLAITVGVNAALTSLLPIWAGPQLGAMGAAYWAAVVALVCGCVAASLICGRGKAVEAWNGGATAAALPLLATGFGYAFGLSLANLSGVSGVLATLSDALDERPLAHVAFTSGLYAAIVGSSSGGLLLWRDLHRGALPDMHVPVDMMHRAAALASGILDTLPHSGAVIALLAICSIRHAAAYRDIAMVSIAAPALGLAVAMVAAWFGPAVL